MNIKEISYLCLQLILTKIYAISFFIHASRVKNRTNILLKIVVNIKEISYLCLQLILTKIYAISFFIHASRVKGSYRYTAENSC